MGRETSVQSPRKTSFGHARAVKQLITVALDLKRQEVDPGTFQSIQLDYYFQDIFCKQANECGLLNRKMMGTLGQMAYLTLSLLYAYGVKPLCSCM